MHLGFCGGLTALLCLTALGLSACGQKGPLILPSDNAAKDSKATYLIKPNKANGEVPANPQTDFLDQQDTPVSN